MYVPNDSKHKIISYIDYIDVQFSHNGCIKADDGAYTTLL